MTFPSFAYGSSSDPVFPYSEGCRNSRFPPDHCHGFYGYPPNLASAPSQNFDFNYGYHYTAKNVPCSSFSAEPCHRLPYSNHTLMPSTFHSEPWAKFASSEVYVPTPVVDSPNQLHHSSVNGCYNVQRSPVLPDPAYYSYLQPRMDCGYVASANLNHQYFDHCSANNGCMQDFRYSAYPFRLKETAHSGTNHCSTVPYDYSIDHIMRDTVAPSAGLAGSPTINRHSPLDRNNVQRPSFTHSASPELINGRNFFANSGEDTFPKSVDFCSGESCKLTCQSLTDISQFSGTQKMSTDRVGSEDCRDSSSDMVISSVSDEALLDTILTMANELLGDEMPELPQSSEPIMCGQLSTGVESLCNTSSDCSVCPDQIVMNLPVASASNTSECKTFEQENEKFGAAEVEVDDVSCVPLADVHTVSSSVVSTSVHMEHHQIQTASHEKTQVAASVIPSVVNIGNKCLETGTELMREGTETAESCDMISESLDAASNASDDVIVLSPSVDDEPGTTFSTNLGNNTIRPSSDRMQPTCISANSNFDRNLSTVVPTTVPGRSPHVGNQTLGASHCQSSPSVPLTSQDLRKSRNHPFHAKQIVNRSCSMLTTSCQRQLSCTAIPTTSHMMIRHSSADATTCRSMKQVCAQPPITLSHDSVQKEHNHFAQIDLERLRHMKPLELLDALSKQKGFNATAGSKNPCSVLENGPRARFQKSVLLRPVLPQHRIAHTAQQHAVYTTSSSRNMQSISSSGIRHVSATAGTNRSVLKRNQFMTYSYRPHMLPSHRQGSSALQLQGLAMRRNGTYSVRAAGALLQRLKQGKLPDIVSLHTARQQQLLNRRMSLLSRPLQASDIIDLTCDDDGEENAVESCETIFARTRRRGSRIPFLRQPRPYFVRKSSAPDGSCFDPKLWPRKTAFEVDRSLPFYRCFVQKLLRNFKFGASGVPAKISPELPEVFPSATYGTVSATRRDHKADDSCVYKALVDKRQPVVMLKKLDQSVLDEFGSANVTTSESGDYILSTTHRNESENCVSQASSLSVETSNKVLSLESPEKVSAPVSEYGLDTHLGQQSTESECTEKADIQKDSETVKLNSTGWRCSDLLSLCRPVSVVLERLDKIKIENNGKVSCKTRKNHQENRPDSKLRTGLSDSDFSWTVTQIPRANKVPILVIRPLSLSTWNSPEKKLAKESKVCSARQLRSTSECQGNQTAGSYLQRNLAPGSSKFDTSRKMLFKKTSGQKRLKSLLKISLQRIRRGREMQSESHEHLHEPESSINSVYRNMSSLPSDEAFTDVNAVELSTHSSTVVDNVRSEPDNANVTNPIPTGLIVRNLAVFNNNIQEKHAASDSNTVELPTHSRTDVNTSVGQGVCLVPSNAFSSDLFPRDSDFNEHSPEDYASSDSDTVVLSPQSSVDATASFDQELESVDPAAEDALLTDLFPQDATFCKDLPEDCESSNSDTIALSPRSSTDDLTVNYRSSVSEIFDFEEPLLDWQEMSDESSDACHSSEKFDLLATDSGQELKPQAVTTVEVDCNRQRPTSVQLDASVSVEVALDNSGTSLEEE